MTRKFKTTVFILHSNLLLHYTASKISIEHVTIFLSKYVSKSAVDMKCSPDVGNNPSKTNKFRN